MLLVHSIRSTTTPRSGVLVTERAKKMARQRVASMLAVALIVVGAFASFPTAVQSTGVCYGMMGNNLPPSSQVVQLYKSTGIDGMRIYSPDKATLEALKGSGIGTVIIDTGNGNLCQLARNPSSAASWVQSNIKPYYPAVNIRQIAVGNEVQGSDTQCIVPAMRNMQAALNNAGVGAVKASTAVRFDVIKNSFPPSSGVFAQSYMTDVARFLASTGAPLLANVYPYFAYRDNPRDISLGYATFQPGTSVRDNGNGLTYHNLFDAMVDAMYAALDKAGTGGVKIVVSESGWPSDGGFGASKDNARNYNQGLINHISQGTPRKPGRITAYIFAMFNENQKTGDATERNFGIFYPNKQPVYPLNFRG
ncbi:hypothetical protein EJB05_16566 [Eragrostis curvula]|uniref:Glucan endo-1,3-beta-D-glucosidase n=1 Tax=Eragrostis curvula TaxID=38414 RepID=A0A5J9VF03_9POAL|nr:hypothetical protein EJB05_16566 [Eragrostis curvula]